MKAPFAIALRIIKQLTNDRRTIGMIVVVPIIITMIFGYAFTGETFDNPIIVVNLDEGVLIGNTRVSLGDSIVDFLGDDDRVRIVEKHVSTFDEAKKFVLDKSVDGVILLPGDLTKSLNSTFNITTSIIVLFDEAEPAIGGSIFKALSDALNDGFNKIGTTSPITIKKEFAWGIEEIKGLDISLPGVIGYINMFLIILLTVLLVVREDLEGTKARFYSAPISRWSIMLGYMLGMMFFAILISFVVLSVSILLFNAEIRGSIYILIGFLLYFALGTVMLALFLARIARNELQAMQMAVLVAIPSMALSGFMVPINTLPDWLGAISPIIPLTYAVEGMKSIMLRGMGIEDILFEVGALTVYIVLAFLGAVFASKETVA